MCLLFVHISYVTPHWVSSLHRGDINFPCIMCGVHHSSAAAPTSSRCNLCVKKWFVMMARWHTVSHYNMHCELFLFVMTCISVMPHTMVCAQYIYQHVQHRRFCTFPPKIYGPNSLSRCYLDENDTFLTLHELWRGFITAASHVIISDVGKPVNNYRSWKQRKFIMLRTEREQNMSLNHDAAAHANHMLNKSNEFCLPGMSKCIISCICNQ